LNTEKIREVFNKIASKFDSDMYISIGEKILSIIFIFIAVKIAIKFGYVLIDKFFANQKKMKISFDERKANTLSTILKSILRYTMYFIAVTTILRVIEIPTESILAAAGLGGLAIGFGAQGLVKDVITGFFILFEDQFSVGDYIITGSLAGTVEEIGLRITKLKDFNGDVHIVPNGSIDRVTNKSMSSMRALVEISVAYEENLDHVIEVLNRICDEIKSSREDLVEGPTVLGVTKLGDSEVGISILAKTTPMQQWAVEREIRKKVKDTFDKEDIEIPYPRRVIINKSEEREK